MTEMLLGTVSSMIQNDVIRSSVTTINAIAQNEYAIKVIQKKIIKSVTKRFVTDII